MRIQALALALLTSAVAVQAHADYDYPEARLTVTRAFTLTAKNGAKLNLTPGQAPASLKVESYGMFGGAGSVTVKNAQGEVKIDLPKKTFSEGWKFMAPASDVGQQVGIRGADSKHLQTQPPREELIQCRIQPAEVQVLNPSSGQAMSHIYRDLNGQARQGDLVIRVCAQVVNGVTHAQQITGMQSCAPGTQKVVKQLRATTEVYKVEFLDPASGQVVGTLEAVAPRSRSASDDVIQILSACQ